MDLFARKAACLLMVAALSLPSPAFAEELVCDGEKVRNLSSLDSGQVSHIETYCVAADAAKKAQGSQGILRWTHSAVAAVCAAACFTSWTGISEGVCTYSALGGSVVDAGVLISFGKEMEAVSRLTSLGTTVALNHGVLFGAGKEAAAQAGKEATKSSFSVGSCVTSVIEGITATGYFIGHSESKKTAEANEQKAREQFNRSLSAHSVVVTGGGVGGRAATIGGSAEPPAAKSGFNASSGESIGEMGFDALISQALAIPGNNLPLAIASPEFKSALERMTGMKADQFARIEDPSQLMRTTLKSSLNDEGVARFESAYSKVLASADLSKLDTGIRYASSGRGSKGGSNEPDFNSIMDRMMGGLLNKDGKQEAPGKGRLVEFGRGLAGSRPGDEENPGISLFDRITRRYQVSSERITQLPYQSPENQVLSTR